MRRLLVAGLAALAVVLGLVASMGVASAAVLAQRGVLGCTQVASPDAKCDNSADKTENLRRVDHGCLAGTHWNGTACVPNPVGDPTCTVDHNPRVPGCQNSGPIYGGGNGSWNDRLDGRYFRLDQGPALDVCDSGASSYDLWLNRNSSYRDRIVRQLNAQRWNDLRRADCGVVVSNDGQCVTYVQARDSIRNWNNDYNRLRGVYNGDFNRLNTTDRDNLRRLWDNSSRYRGQWDSTLSRLRTVCQDNTPAVTIIQAPPVVLQAPAAAPAPVYSAPAPSGVSAGSSVPSGAVQTGGDSPAFVLAHNRAV